MNQQECAEHFFKTGKIPPVNLLSWVPCYSLITSAGWDKVININS